jgi:hypothetical protein
VYVLDTDVLSLTNATAGVRTAEIEGWRRWVNDNHHGLFLSVITLMEIQYGIEKCRAKGATNKAERLKKWLAAAEPLHHGRILPVSIEIARRAGELLSHAVASGAAPSSEDAIIAATAEVSGFTVLSRNAKDMQALTAAWLNPLETPPPPVPRP